MNSSIIICEEKSKMCAPGGCDNCPNPNFEELKSVMKVSYYHWENVLMANHIQRNA